MADAQLTVLIELQNRMSSELDKIKKDVNSLADDSQKNTEKIAEGFTNSTDRLLAMGNMASSVDSIFSTLENTQIRLENATERLKNAQDRLQDAHTKLIRLAQSGKATSEDLADAQNEVDRATRNLTISENNLDRVKNHLIGTVINLETQVVKLAFSIPTLINDLQILTKTTTILEAVTSPFALVLASLATVAGILTYNYLTASDSSKQFKDSQDLLIPSVDGVNDSLQTQRTNLDNMIISLIFAKGKTLELLDAEKRLKEFQQGQGIGGTRADLAPGLSAEQEAEIERVRQQMEIDRLMKTRDNLPKINPRTGLRQGPTYTYSNDGQLISIENVIKLDGKVIDRSMATAYGTKVSY